MVLEITKNKRIDAELLEKIVTEMEERASASPSTKINDQNDQVSSYESTIDTVNESTGESVDGRLREIEQLVDFLGKVLRQVYINLTTLFYASLVELFCVLSFFLPNFRLSFTLLTCFFLLYFCMHGTQILLM